MLRPTLRPTSRPTSREPGLGPRRREPAAPPPLHRSRRRRPGPACGAARWALALVLAALGTAGCSQVVRKATSESVGAGLDAVNAAQNRAKLETLLTSEEVRAITRQLTDEVVDAALADLTGEARQTRLHELAVEFVDRLVPVIAKDLSTEVWPELERALTGAVEKVVDQTLSPEVAAKVKALAAEVARGTIEAAGPEIAAAIADGVSAGVERAVRTLVAEQLQPALETLVAGDPPLVRRLAREATHGALLGVADAMNPEGEGFDAVWDRERDELIAAVNRGPVIEQVKVIHKLTVWNFVLGGLALLLLILSAVLFFRLRAVHRAA
jgi:hypothetical protein